MSKNVSFADILKAISVIAPIFTDLVAMIKVVEAEGGTGEEKKSAVMTWLESLLEGGSQLTDDLTDTLKDEIKLAASVVIDAIVAMYNVRGWFKHKTA